MTLVSAVAAVGAVWFAYKAVLMTLEALAELEAVARSRK